MEKKYLFFDLSFAWAGRTQIGFHCDDKLKQHILRFIEERSFFRLIEGGMDGIVEQDGEASGYTIVTWLDFCGFAERELERTGLA